MQPATGSPGMEVVEMSPGAADDPAQVIPESLADLLTTSASDTAGSVDIMTIYRGPKIGPETD